MIYKKCPMMKTKKTHRQAHSIPILTLSSPMKMNPKPFIKSIKSNRRRNSTNLGQLLDWSNQSHKRLGLNKLNSSNSSFMRGVKCIWQNKLLGLIKTCICSRVAKMTTTKREVWKNLRAAQTVRVTVMNRRRSNKLYSLWSWINSKFKTITNSRLMMINRLSNQTQAQIQKVMKRSFQANLIRTSNKWRNRNRQDFGRPTITTRTNITTTSSSSKILNTKIRTITIK